MTSVKKEGSCGRCAELHFEVAFSQKEVPEGRTVGLSESALRNMLVQRLEALAHAQRRLQNHQKACAVLKCHSISCRSAEGNDHYHL